MLERLPVDDVRVNPALILAAGLVKTSPSVNEDFSRPEGSCFFVSSTHIATARHNGEILRSDLREEGYLPQGNVQPYGQNVFNPRLDLTWKAGNEFPFAAGDISIVSVVPEFGVEATERYQLWLAAMSDPTVGLMPTIRMTPLVEGEPLTFKGFTYVEFSFGNPRGQHNRLQHGTRAVGIVGSGFFRNQVRESDRGIEVRPTIDGVSCLGQNSGGPVLDSVGRIVGVISNVAGGRLHDHRSVP